MKWLYTFLLALASCSLFAQFNDCGPDIDYTSCEWTRLNTETTIYRFYPDAESGVLQICGDANYEIYNSCDGGSVCCPITPTYVSANCNPSSPDFDLYEIPINQFDAVYITVLISCCSPDYVDIRFIPDGTTCDEPLSIQCGATLAGTTITENYNYDANNYDCIDPSASYNGADEQFQFILDQSSDVAVYLRDFTADLDLFVLNQAGHCVAYSTNTGNCNYELASAELPPGTYTIVVDGKENWDASNFTISLFCECIQEDQNCNNIHYQYITNGSGLIYDFYNQNSSISPLLWQSIDDTGETTNYFACDDPNGNLNDIRVRVEEANDEAKVCFYYWDASTNCIQKCCKYLCTNNPEAPPFPLWIDYEGPGLNYVFRIAPNTYVEEVAIMIAGSNEIIIDTWEETILDMAEYGGEGTYEFQANYYDGLCWKTTAVDVCIQDAADCSDNIEVSLEDNKYRFFLNHPTANFITWKFVFPDSTIDIGNFQDNPATYDPAVDTPLPCGTYTVNVHFFDQQEGCWKDCQRQVYICLPDECDETISYQYNPSNQSYTFSIDPTGISDISWINNGTNQTIGFGADVDIAINGNCNQYSLSVQYYDEISQTWRLCSEDFWLCNPQDCADLINVNYLPASSSYQLSIASDGLSNISWAIDAPIQQSLGAGSTSNPIPLTADCNPYTVSVYYFDLACDCWQVCSVSLILCQPPTEICDNGIDDDGDGFIDCEDQDCWNSGLCHEICGNGQDDDGDGLTDCEDPDCWVNGQCPEICGDGIDNDNDGYTDCEDSDCWIDGQCAEICGDGIDNDNDGYTDCEDSDCWVNGQCAEICGDGIR